MKKLIMTFTILFIISTGAILAQRGTVSNSARQGAHQARIAQGVQSGELTRRETRVLEREQRKIQIEKRMAQADGKVTPAEKRFLRREQNRASRHIARKKRDRQGR